MNVKEKQYLAVEDLEVYEKLCRMLNGLEKSLEGKIPERDRRWKLEEESESYTVEDLSGWPADTRNLVSSFH